MAVYKRNAQGRIIPKHMRAKTPGTWYYDFTISKARHREAIPEARTQAQAERVETRKLEEVYNGQYCGTRRQAPKNLKAFIDEEYLPIVRENTRYFSTGTGYETRIVSEKFGGKALNEMSQFEIEKWLISLKPIYKGTTINHFIKRLKAIFARAVKAGYVESNRNPAEGIGKVEEIKVTKRRLSPEQEAAILKACEDLGFDYVRRAVIMLLETGMRPTELFKMKCAQLVLSQGIVIAISYKGRIGLQPAEPKERAIPLTTRARSEFEALLREAEGERIYPYGDIKKSWERVRELAAKDTNDPELAGFWLRWLRDEAENRWREAGMHPLDIALLMGHSSPRTTMIYHNPRLSLLRSQMQNVSGMSQEVTDNLIRLPVSG